MPLSLFDYGRRILDEVIGRISDPVRRKAVERDRDSLYASPKDHGLPTFPHKGEDNQVPWPTLLIMLGGSVAVRYAIVEGHPGPLVVEVLDVEAILEGPDQAPNGEY